MQRRSLLLGLAGCAATAASGAVRGGIIDTHTHFYDPSRPEGVPWPPKDDSLLYRTTLPGRYVQLTRGLGIEGTIAVEAGTPWVEDNQWILDLARTNPVIVGLVGRLDAGGRDFARHLERFHANPLFLGIRLGAETIRRQGNSPEFLRNLKRLSDSGLALDVVGDSGVVADAVRLNDRIPELRIVIDHLPFDGPANADARSAYQAAMREAAHRKKIAAKISDVLRKVNGAAVTDAAHYRGALDEAAETFGEDRVLYGSNWPVSDLRAPYASVLGVMQDYFSDKSEAAAEKYFRRNSQAIYRWKARG